MEVKRQKYPDHCVEITIFFFKRSYYTYIPTTLIAELSRS